MCGIVATLDFQDKRPADDRRLGSMLDAIEHRGPDDVGSWTDGEVGLGNRRLSIIDLAGGHQPMASEDGSLVVVCNGEIYNYRQLAEDLRRRGHRFRSSSDTEVLLHLYEEHGDDLVDRLRGMFAFALWDGRRRRLLVARDRVGIKPLYYRVSGGELVLASEIKAVLAAGGPPPAMDHEALCLFLALKYVPSPATLFEGVASLPPGHLLVCDAAGPRVLRWWDLSFATTGPAPDEAEAVDRLRATLEDAVRAHLVSDVPVGAFLSGGLDSSTVVALMAGLTDRPVRTFAVGYGGAHSRWSELPYARLVSERYATEHTELLVSADDMVDALDTVVWHLDQPIADEAVLPSYLLSVAARRDVKVVLTGEGGDELFAGYARYAGERLSPLTRRVPPAVAQTVRAGASRLPGLRRPKLALSALLEPDEARRLVRWFPLFSEEALGALLSDPLRSHVDTGGAAEVFREHLARADGPDVLSRMLYVDTKLWLPDDLLARGDKTSMAASLEARLPLLDHAVVELAASLPSSLKLRGRSRKHVLRAMSAPLLPREVLDRRKQGFPTPVSDWFRAGAETFLRDHLSETTVRRRGLFSPAAVIRLLAEHRSGAADHGPLLFGLLSLEIWMRQFLDRPTCEGRYAA